MRIRLGVPPDLNRDEKAAILDAALEAVTLANEPLVRTGRVPTAEDGIRGAGIRWRPEPPGDEHFDLATTVMGRGHGDCDDLAPWHAASLRVTGVDPEARAIVRPSGPGRWHALVQRSNGTLEDPSIAAGMGVVGGDDYMGPFWSPMWPGRVAIAHHPLAQGLNAHAARVEVPDMQLPMHWSSLFVAPDPVTAVRGAIEGSLCCAGQAAHPDHLALVSGIYDLLSGHSPAVVQEAYDHIGFLPGITAALPIASGILNAAGGLFGGGAKPPPAAPAPAPSGGGGGGGMPFPMGGGGGSFPTGPVGPASGPIIIRF